MGFKLAQPDSRREFFRKALAFAAGLPFAVLLAEMLRRENALQAPGIVNIPPDIATGLSVVEGAIVHREGDGAIRAYAARCTHLGCRIDRVVGDEVVCPCHGSRFRADGSVAAGPATRPLAAMRIEPDPKSGGWIARASS